MPEAPTSEHSQTRERYLLALYKLQRFAQGADVPMGDLAGSLSVVPGTATTMMKRLAADGLVRYRPYAGVALTAAGRRAALRLVRRHRLLECFLIEVLGYGWSDVHAEAERLEHGVSEQLLARIDAYLGHPDADPHGNPIPDAAGVLASDEAVPLARCPSGERLRFVRIGALSPDFLELLGAHGWQPGSEGLVVGNDPVAETVQLQAEGAEALTISRGAAEQIFVELL